MQPISVRYYVPNLIMYCENFTDLINVKKQIYASLQLHSDDIMVLTQIIWVHTSIFVKVKEKYF